MPTSTVHQTVPASVPVVVPLYTLATRLFHLALAFAIVVQLASSFLMMPPLRMDSGSR